MNPIEENIEANRMIINDKIKYHQNNNWKARVNLLYINTKETYLDIRFEHLRNFEHIEPIPFKLSTTPRWKQILNFLRR